MIKTQDFEIYPEFGRNAQKRQPDNVRYSNGFVPADVLPAEWVNWAWAKNSRGISELNRGLEIVEAELNAILDSGGILPDETTEIKTQVIQAIKNVILQYTGTLTNLNTVHKDTIVQAVNEILSALRAHENRSDNPHGVTKAQVGLGNVPNVQTNDQTPTFSAASSLQPLNSGEKISSLFSKLARAVSEFISHKANRNNPHGVTKAQVGLGNVPNVQTNDQAPTFSAASSLQPLNSGEKMSSLFSKLARAVSEFISHKANRNNPHGVTKAQVGLGNVDNTPDREKKVKHAETADRVIDFGDTSRTVKIGYAGSSLGAREITQLAGYTSINGERVIKDINKETAKKWLGVDKVNADTVDGFHAGNSAGMLIPVTAFSSGNSSGYIKLGNGLIVQWGKAVGDETDVVLPVAYSKYYSISLSVNSHSNSDGWSRTGTYEHKTFNGFHISVCLNSRNIVSDWITIGF